MRLASIRSDFAYSEAAFGNRLTMGYQKPILIADDDENDVFFLRRAFQQAGLPHPIIDVPNGQEAINYLLRCIRDPSAQHPRPALLLLDLKMPLLNGFDVLSWLQERSEFQKMPAVVVSSSDLDLDIKRARELGASDYLVKPQCSDERVKLVQRLLHWLDREFPTFPAIPPQNRMLGGLAA